MAGSLQPRVKTWVATEDVTYSDLNAEFDNALLAMQPLLIDDYSTDTTQMQVVTDPGEVGTESKATTLAGEIARLRFLIKEITGEDYWYESPISSLIGLSNAIGTGLTDNRLVSGRVLTTSAQPAFLVPAGNARTVRIDGTPTNFIYYVNGSEYSLTTDVTLTNLTAAPSTNNTCLINDAVAADQYWTKYAGEDGTEIPVDNMGSEISALIGKYAGFKINNGTTDEYFIAYVRSSTSLTKARRGYFFDSSDNPIPRIVYTDNDVITLMKLTWIFAKTDGTLTATYNNPVWSDDEPSSPAIGDYWFDYSANKWKVYGVGSYSDADAILVGMCLQDATNCVAARSFEFFKPYDNLNTLELFPESNASVRTRLPGMISVWGSTIKNEYNLHAWDMTIDRESGVSENASTYYYFYITETGDKVISDKKPHDRRGDLQGYYHPHQSWRCVGYAFNNASSNLTAVNSYYYAQTTTPILHPQTAAANIEVINRVIPLDSTSGAFTQYLPSAAFWRGQVITLIKTSSDLNPITIDAFGAETINGAATISLNTQFESVDLLSDGSNVWLKNRHIPPFGATYTPTINGFGTVSAVSFRYDRRINKCAVEGIWTNGTVAASQARISLPTGLTLDTTRMIAAHSAMYGICFSGADTTATQMPGAEGPFVIIYLSGVTNAVGISDLTDTDDPSGIFADVNGSEISSNNQVSCASFEVPISGWAV